MEAGLDSIHTGMRAVVMQVRGKPRLVNRFYRMGIKPGTVIYCRYRSPGGKVVALEFRDTVLALCTRDLKSVRIACP